MSVGYLLFLQDQIKGIIIILPDMMGSHEKAQSIVFAALVSPCVGCVLLGRMKLLVHQVHQDVGIQFRWMRAWSLSSSRHELTETMP